MNAAADIRHAIERYDWRTERVTRMCELNGAGESFAEIARVLQCSRSAAIGKFNRLSLDAGRAGLTKDNVAEHLAEGDSVDDIARIWGVDRGAVEARLAEIRRGLGSQAI